MENNIDWIQTVKEQENGYLVNGSMSVPKTEGNRHYKDIKVWLESNTPEPEFTEAELAKIESDKQISEAKEYLASTDFYMTVDKYATLSEERKLELTNARAGARVLINSLEE